MKARTAELVQVTLNLGHAIDLLHGDHVGIESRDELAHLEPAARPVDDRAVIRLHCICLFTGLGCALAFLRGE